MLVTWYKHFKCIISLPEEIFDNTLDRSFLIFDNIYIYVDK